jgi:4'-phosphopantetheinyl transferase
MSNAWESVACISPLEDGEIQVCRIELDDNNSLLTACMPFLTAEEQGRAERRRAGKVREEFAVGRACLRILLGNFFAANPLIIPISEGPYGKPSVSMDGRSVFFNVTHSRGIILIALSKSGDVGIDVERIDSITDIIEIAKSAFRSDEVELLISIDSPETRRLAFYRCWTQKEAIVKADGRGLSLPLACFEVPILSAEEAIIDIKEPSREQGKRYLLRDIPLEGPFVGAIASDSHNCRMRWLNFPLSAFESRL